MSLAVLRPERGAASTLFVTPLLVLSLTLIPALPARALDMQAYAKRIVVNPGHSVESVSIPVGDIEVFGAVEEDVETGMGDVLVQGHVGGDVNCGVGNVEVAAPVEGRVRTGMGDVYVNSRVGGGIQVGHGNVHLQQNARVSSVSTNGAVIKHPGAKIVHEEHPGPMSTLGFASEDESGAFGFAGWLLVTLAFVAASVLLAVIAPRPLSATAASAGRSPLWSLLTGVVSIPVFVILAVVLSLSVVGIPLLLLLTPAYLAFVVFGALAVAYFVGRRVLFATGRYRGGNALAATVGALLVAATVLIPVVGDILLSALVLLGTGAALLALFSRRSRRARADYEHRNF